MQIYLTELTKSLLQKFTVSAPVEHTIIRQLYQQLSSYLEVGDPSYQSV